MQSLLLLYFARMALSSPVLDQGQAILKVEGENTEANIKMANMTHYDHFTLEQGLFNQTISMEYIDIHLLPHHMPYNWSYNLRSSMLALTKNTLESWAQELSRAEYISP